MSWSLEDKKTAASEGWGLFLVFENAAGAPPRFKVLGIGGQPQAERAMRLVVERARQGSELHQRALAEVMRSSPTTTKNRK